MKKLLLIALSLLVFAGLAGATPIDCGGLLMSPNFNSPTAGPACTATADAGFFISSLTLTSTDDYTGLQLGSPTMQFFIVFLQNPGFANINGIAPVYPGTPNGCQVVTGGTGSTPCANTPQTINGSFGPSATVQLAAGNTVAGGAVTGGSVTYTLDYAETASPVPEPATLGIMGGAFLGLGFLARRKK